MHRERSTLLASALRAAQEGRRDDLRALLDKLGPRPDLDVPLDELWLAAEAAYLRADYAGAIDLFGRFDRDHRSSSTPSWQRYLSAHRRAFASLQLGWPAKTSAAIEEAATVFRESPELASRYSDLTAMRGHLQELQGDFEGARASFELAHAAALKRDDANRAMTTASDLGRILGVLGRPADGLVWLERAEEQGRQALNERAMRTVRLRRAMLLGALGMSREALGILDELIIGARENGGPELLIDALARRSDVLRSMSRLDDAERDLREAIKVASAAKLARHELYARKDAASLYLERASADDLAHAIQEFGAALKLAAAFVPPQPLVLMQLAESVISTPALLGLSSLPSGLRTSMTDALEAARRTATSSIYQRRERARAFDRAVGRLSGLLASLSDEEIALATHVIMPRAGRVRSSSGETRRINASEIATLRLLLDAPRGGITIKALGDRLGKSSQATSKSVMRVRLAINGDLLVRRVGQERRYSLRLRKVTS